MPHKRWVLILKVYPIPSPHSPLGWVGSASRITRKPESNIARTVGSSYFKLVPIDGYLHSGIRLYLTIVRLRHVTLFRKCGPESNRGPFG